MTRKKISPKPPPKKNRRDSEPIAWRYCFLTLICGLLLVIGFFFAARQHFSSIDFSIKNSRLKKQIDELVDDKRRLQYEKEVALTPNQIKKAAKKIGFTEMTASDTEDSRSTGAPQEKPQVGKTVEAKTVNSVSSKSSEVKKDDKKAEKEEKKVREVKKEKSPVNTAKK